MKEGDRRYKRSIKQRPSYVESRKTQGHWEGDTIISRKDKQALLTLVERKTGLVLIGRLNQRTAAETRDMIIKLLTPFKKKVKSITI
ncbi:MAG: IS30 family transposase [Gilliamella sp.]|uniref:IS30 family transposase n=1 Tax=Gilliamella sp. TaxID=1891236 RepID=UPI003458321D|nr:IS30 family transposase [Gilliamella sp.]MCO6553287.1 IS30 family transposase [Gilliamella sp.]